MKTKTAEEIMAKINPSTPHSLTVWTDEMVIQAMHEYASQGAEEVDWKVISFAMYLTGHDEGTIKQMLNDWQPSSCHQQNGSPVDGREWVRVEDVYKIWQFADAQRQIIVKKHDESDNKTEMLCCVFCIVDIMDEIADLINPLLPKA